MKFLNTVTVSKRIKGAFRIFQYPFGCKLSKQLNRGPFGAIKKFSKKVSQCRKKSKFKSPKFGSFECFRSSGRWFRFGRGSDISSMLRTSIVQAEQMNKKVQVIKKTTHCESLVLFFKSTD